MARYRPWARALAGLVIVALGVATAAPVAAAAPAAGAERQTKAPEAARPISASVAAAVALAPLAAPAAAVRLQEQQAPAPATGSPSFFRSPKGIAALVLFVGGVAFTLHSMDKDRIHSPVR